MKQTEYLNLKQKIKKINDPLVSRTFLDILERVRNLEDEIKKVQDSKPEKIPVEKNEDKVCDYCKHAQNVRPDDCTAILGCPYFDYENGSNFEIVDGLVKECGYFEPKE